MTVNSVTAEMESARQKKTVNEEADIPTDLNIAYQLELFENNSELLA